MLLHNFNPTLLASFNIVNIGLCDQQILFPPFRYSGTVEKFSGPVDSWCSLVLDQCTFEKKN